MMSLTDSYGILYIMILFKKLILAPIFLITFALLIYQLNPILHSYDLVFSLSIDSLIGLAVICSLIVTSSFLFILLATIASDWKVSLPVSIISSAIPLIFIQPSLALVFTVAILVSLLLTNLNLDAALKSYLTFQPTALLGPPIRHLFGLLILSFCLVYFLSVNKIVAQNGFQIPDSLIDTALKLAPLPQADNQTETALPQLSKEQINFLKQNPELLKQSGLDPKILDTLEQPKSAKAPQELTNDLIKQTVKDQLQNLIKPYINFIPALLALLLYFTLQFLTSILNLLIYPLLWLAFWILEKTGFVKFEIEQRPVKKMVV